MVASLKSGMAFGPFELVAPIRRGGMGEVWQAARVGEGGWRKEVALKVMRPSLADEAKFVAQFRHEAQLSALLAHPNLVGVTNFGREEDSFWLELEYVQGEDLYQLLERTPGGVPVPIALFTVTEILKGLEHALTRPGADGHPFGIIHRDLKPSNVLIAREGHVKVADFGLAKMLADGAGTILGFRGTIGYRAPEQFLGQDASPASDVFSVGLILWELLTGGPLFAAATEGERMRLIEACVVPPLPPLAQPVPDGLDAVLRRFLARSPTERYADAGQALAALLALPVSRPATSYDLKRFLAQLGAPRPSPAAGTERPAVAPPAPPAAIVAPTPAVTPPAAPPAPSRSVSSTFEHTLLRSPAMFKTGAPSGSVSAKPAPAASPAGPPPKLAPQLVVPPAPPSLSTIASSPPASIPSSSSVSGPRAQPPLVAAPPPLVAAPPLVASTSPSAPPSPRAVPPPLVAAPPLVFAPVAPPAPEAGDVRTQALPATPPPLAPAAPPSRLPSSPLQQRPPSVVPSAGVPTPAQLLQPPPPVGSPPIALRGLSSVASSGAPAPLSAPAPLAAPPPPVQFAGSSPSSEHAPLLAAAPLRGGVSAPASPVPRRRAHRPAAAAPGPGNGPAVVDGLPPPVEREPLHKRPVVIVAAAALALILVVVLVFAVSGRSEEKGTPTMAPGAWPAPAVAPASPGFPAPSPAGQVPARDASGLSIVQVVTDPPDARLVVNGIVIPGSSPFVIRDVDSRWPVRIRVEAPGFETFDQEVAVAGAKASLPVKLQPRSAAPRGAR